MQLMGGGVDVLGVLAGGEEIAAMPLPREMFLPLSAQARLLVIAGQAVGRGEVLAEGGDCADVCAPADGVVAGAPKMRQLAAADGAFAPCLPFLPNSPNLPMLPPIAATSDVPTAPTAYKRFGGDNSPADFLKKMGIIGLGGAAMPAWRKYRSGAHTLLINGLESDDAIFCDRVLLAARADVILRQLRFCADVLDIPRVVIAIRQDAPYLDADCNADVEIRRFDFAAPRHDFWAQFRGFSFWSDNKSVDSPSFSLSQTNGVDSPSPIPMTSVTDNYALGAERMLIRTLFALDIPPNVPPADYGILSFNLGTIAAIYDAFYHGQPMQGRVLSHRFPTHLHPHGNDKIPTKKSAKNKAIAGDIIKKNDGESTPLVANARAVFVPFGVTLRDVAAFVGLPDLPADANLTAIVGGIVARETLAADAVVCAQTNAVEWMLPPAISPSVRPPQSACIRCGDCLPICPENLSPLRLFALWLDRDIDRMQREESLDACILCRRCDTVCPSKLPLADSFAAARQQVRRQQQQQDNIKRRSVRYARHVLRTETPRPIAQLDPAQLAKQAQRAAKQQVVNQTKNTAA